MRLRWRSALVATVAAAALAFCGSADAANVIVGPALTGTWSNQECARVSCTVLNGELGEAGTTTSPISGTIVRYSVVGGETAGQYRLRTANPDGGFTVVFSHWSDPVDSVPSVGVQSFGTSLPVEAGQTIALTMSDGASLGRRDNVGRRVEWTGEIPEKGESPLAEVALELVGFNAEVQPPPTITSLGTTSGPAGGGTAVTIAGTDLQNVSAVDFGGNPAASFESESEGRLTAVSPPSAGAASVPVSVTTIAGKATAPQTFRYEAPPTPEAAPAPAAVAPPPTYCVVPNLVGRKLRAAKRALLGAKCKLGSIKKRGGAPPKSGKVSKQGAKAGSRLPVDTKVGVTLKPPKPAAKQGKKRRK